MECYCADQEPLAITYKGQVRELHLFLLEKVCGISTLCFQDRAS